MEYLCESNSGFNYAASLTFLKAPRSKEQAQKIGMRFQHSYNIALGMNNWRRKYKKDKRKRAAIVAVLEKGGQTGRLHYHLMLSKPDEMQHTEFVELIQKAWAGTGNGGTEHNKIEPIFDLGGWVNYITKKISSTSTDAVHADATHTFTEKLSN